MSESSPFPCGCRICNQHINSSLAAKDAEVAKLRDEKENEGMYFQGVLKPQALADGYARGWNEAIEAVSGLFVNSAFANPLDHILALKKPSPTGEGGEAK